MIRTLLNGNIFTESLLAEAKKCFTIVTGRFVDVKIPVVNVFGIQQFPHGRSTRSLYGLLHARAKGTILCIAEIHISV